MIGASRGPDDDRIIKELKEKAERIGVSDSVDFAVNRTRSDILGLFRKAKVAIHTMRDEHFGISIVEMMSAGLVVIAHASAGPKMDIIGAAHHSVGYLADSQAAYAKYVVHSMLNYESSDIRNLR
jgi:alpha-1,2-mannosyltransferase